MDITIYYKDANTDLFYCYNKNKCYTTKKLNDFNFEMFQGYDANEKGLIKFYKDFNEWNEELKNIRISDDIIKDWKDKLNETFTTNNGKEINTLWSLKTYKFDLKRFKTRFGGVVFSFYDILRKMKIYERIKNNYSDVIEYKYINNTYNSGIMFFDEKYKNLKFKSSAIDYSKFYPYIYGSKTSKLLLPINKGKEFYLDKLPKKIQYGIYKVKISCDDVNIKKHFIINKNNCYTHIDLSHALFLQKYYKITIELIKDIKYNAYIYDEKNLVASREIFGLYFDILNIENSNNKLQKHLLSSLTGHLNTHNKIYYFEEEDYKYNDDEYTLIDDTFINVNDESKHKFIVVHNDKPYKYELARIFTFVLSYARRVISNTIFDFETDNCKAVRIHTDGIIFDGAFDDEKRKRKIYNLKIEDKYNNKYLEIKNVNHIKIKCKKCKEFIISKDFKTHKC